MRFLEDGINIPDELLWALDDQRVVFFCGAGVSQATAKLPDFNGLTNQVLDGLGARADNDARRVYEASQKIESQLEIAGLVSADRVFGQLRRDFTDEQIEKVVANSLQPKDDVDLTAHKTMLRLATLPTGETRLITTNFDRLFEAAGKKLQISTRSSLPNIEFTSANWGVVHLHGVVTPDYSQPTSDGFVLSSGEFGEAYLSHGWARDFIKKVLENYVPVFVGYTADDPPVRYLLEGLQKYTGKNKAYAFQPVPNDQAIVAWDEKGVSAIPFDVNGPKGFNMLWETLSEWSNRSSNPRRWRDKLISKARKGPRSLLPHERGMVAHLVKSRDGARAFSEAKPPMPSEWLCVFDSYVRYGEPGSQTGGYTQDAKIDPHTQYKLDSDLPPRIGGGQSSRIPEDTWNAFDLQLSDLQSIRDNNLSAVRGYAADKVANMPARVSYLSSWIIKTANQPQCAWWAARQVALHPEIIERIQWSIRSSNNKLFSPVLEKSWSAISEYSASKKLDRDKGYSFKFPAKKPDFHEFYVGEYVNLFEPHLKNEALFRSPVPPQSKRGIKIRDIVRYDIEYPKGVLSTEVPDEYLSILVPRLSQALYRAWDFNSRYSYYSDFVSIEPDDPREDEGDSSFHRGYQISGHIIHYVSLFKRLAQLRPELALAEMESWPSENPLFSRMRIWAFGNLKIAPASTYAEEVLTVSIRAFWPFKGNRDLLLGLKNRWEEFTLDEKRKVERRILKGPPKLRGESLDRQASYSAYAILNRIYWLLENGCDLSFDPDVKIKKLQRFVPDWSIERAKDAARTHDGGGGMVRVDTEVGDISTMDAAAIIPYIRKMKTRPWGKLVEYDPFSGLSKTKPSLALEALKSQTKSKDFPSAFWSKFLRTESRSEDPAAFTISIARILVKIKNSHFADIALTISQWFEVKAIVILRDDPTLFQELWDKFLFVLKKTPTNGKSVLVRGEDEQASPDWVTEAINSPAGNLAQYLDANRGKDDFEKNEGLLPYWKSLAETLLALPGDSKRYAIAAISFNLNYLFYVDQEWTSQNLISILQDANAQDKQAFWSGFFWGARTPGVGLYKLLKNDLLRMAREGDVNQRRHVEHLSGILLAGWNSKIGDTGERLVGSAELRALILDAGDEFRRQILWNLGRFSEHEHWNDQLTVFLSKVWPKQKTIRTKETSSRLVELALGQKENFKDVAKIVLDLVSIIDDQRLFIPELRRDGETIAGQYPDETLDLLHAILPENPSHWPYGADAALRTIGNIKLSLKANPKFIELESRLS